MHQIINSARVVPNHCSSGGGGGHLCARRRLAAKRRAARREKKQPSRHIHTPAAPIVNKCGPKLNSGSPCALVCLLFFGSNFDARGRPARRMAPEITHAAARSHTQTLSSQHYQPLPSWVENQICFSRHRPDLDVCALFVSLILDKQNI
jgi:hypothetical protein